MTSTPSAPLEALYSLHDTTPVRRAWPRPNGSLHIELILDEVVRAGLIDATDTPTLLKPARDKKLPLLSERATLPEARLVVHRYNRRAVVLFPDRAEKILRPGKEAPVAEKTQAMAPVLREAGFAAAEVTEVSDGMVSTSIIPGRTLHELGDNALEGWREFAARWPQVASANVDVPTHTAHDEVEVLNTWRGHVEKFRPFTHPGPLFTAIEKVQAELLGSTPDPERVLHRDLHDKQLLFDGHTLGVLDVDTAARGEAALDIGNLVAHLRLRQAQGLLSATRAEEYGAIVRDLGNRLGASSQRVETYTQATALRIACLYAFRPAARTWLDGWVATHT